VIGGLFARKKQRKSRKLKFKKPVIQKIGETIESLVPEFLKPKKQKKKPEQE